MTTQGQFTNPDVALNPEIDIDAIRDRFAATGRAQIKDVLTVEAAARFYACLATELPWRLAYNDGAQALELTPEQIAQMSPQELGQFEHQILERASREFQYAYSDFPVAKTMNDPDAEKFYVHDVLRFINSDTFITFLKDITGLEGKFYADGHATSFQSGHFLTIHDDRDTNDHRAIAYVFNLTPNWRPDWGAALQFFDEDLNIVESFAPGHNILNIFSVPQAHAVSFVAPYATVPRFGMTGWFNYAV